MRPPTYSLNSFPVITVQSFAFYVHSFSKIPASLAIATAVLGLSPVIILTLTPPWKHFCTAPGIPYRIGSLMPTIPKIVKSETAYCSVSSAVPPSL